MVLTEGFDAPSVSCIIQARPTKSRLLYMQMIGRGTRLVAGKQDCIILDFVDNWASHSVVTIASLFGLPARFDFGGQSVSVVADRYAAVTADIQDAEPLDATDLDVIAAPVPLWRPDDPERSWVETARGTFQIALSGLTRQRVVVRNSSLGWVVEEIRTVMNLDGVRFKHGIRLESSGGDWPPDELARAFPSAAEARTSVETALSAREEKRAAFAAERAAAAAADWSILDLGRRDLQAQSRIDAIFARDPDRVRAALSTERRAGSKQSPGDHGKRLLRVADRLELFLREKNGSLRPFAVVSCDAHGCDLFFSSTLSKSDPDKFGNVAGAIAELLRAEAMDTNSTALPIAALVERILLKRGWRPALGDLWHLLAR